MGDESAKHRLHLLVEVLDERHPRLGAEVEAEQLEAALLGVLEDLGGDLGDGEAADLLLGGGEEGQVALLHGEGHLQLVVLEVVFQQLDFVGLGRGRSDLGHLVQLVVLVLLYKFLDNVEGHHQVDLPGNRGLLLALEGQETHDVEVTEAVQ